MTAQHRTTNPYAGINAHHLSWLQNEADVWVSFHAAHIGHIKEFLRESLPEGYIARLEQSLQIRRFEAVLDAPAPMLRVVVEDTLPDAEDYATAVMVYQVEGDKLGRPVTRIELLSPSNKPLKVVL